MALDIVTELRSQKVLALPIHDSFLVERRHRFRTGVWMNRLYRDRFRFDPVIKTVE